MTALEIQQTIKNALLEDSYFSEIPIVCDDAMDAQTEAERALSSAGVVALVMLPGFQPGGFDENGRIVFSCESFEIQIGESVAARAAGKPTAADIAMHAAQALSPYAYSFQGIALDNSQRGLVRATVRFDFSFVFTLPTQPQTQE